MKYNLLIIFIFSISCNSIKLQHIHSPKTENEISINKWLKKADFINSNTIVYTVKPQYFLNLDLSMKIGFNPLIYPTHTKRLLIYNGCTSEECMKAFSTYTANLAPNTLGKGISQTDSIILIKKGLSFINEPMINLTQYFCTLQGVPTQLPIDNHYDYYLIMPFALFYGDKKQVKEIKNYLKMAQTNLKSKFKLILINMDKQEWWGKEWNKNIDFSIKIQ